MRELIFAVQKNKKLVKFIYMLDKQNILLKPAIFRILIAFLIIGITIAPIRIIIPMMFTNTKHQCLVL